MSEATTAVEKTIRDVLKELLSSQGLEGVLVNPGLDHDGDALWKMGERRFPHLRYDFHDDQRILGTENW